MKYEMKWKCLQGSLHKLSGPVLSVSFWGIALDYPGQFWICSLKVWLVKYLPCKSEVAVSDLTCQFLSQSKNLRPILINRYMLTTFTRNSARNVCASLHQGLSEYNCLYYSGPIWWCIHFFFHILEEKANDSFSPLATRKQEQRIPNTTCLHIQNPKDLKILNIFQLIVLKYLHLALHRAAVLFISTF